MAEPCNVAFGRYLKALRERRGLSLDEVQSLSQVFPEPIGKTYLSRCENGKQKLAFSKMIPLSRIYEVPPEVLVERMELDLELDRAGGPETEGLSFAELTRRGRAASDRGHFTRSYGYLRDAVSKASTAKLLDHMASPSEQLMCAIMSYAIIAAHLSGQSLSLHELEYIRRTQVLSDRHLVNLFILLSEHNIERLEIERAFHHARRAVAGAERTGSDSHRAFAFSNLARVSYWNKDYDKAIELYNRSFSLFKRAELLSEAARCLLNSSQVYLDSDRLAAAKRAVAAAERLAVKNEFDRCQALTRILRGEIAEKEGQPEKAVRYWRESIDISKKLRDRVMRFKAEFQLYRHSLDVGDMDTAMALERLMRKRAVGIPNNLEELVEFKTLVSQRENV
jgi:tetratricopeptide (TPR) repeat protein